MDSAFIHQAANELVQTAGTRNIKQIACSCSLDISETSRIKDMLGLLSLYFDKPLILINRQLDKQTKQMVCGYALGHYLEHQLLMDLHTLNKFLTIKDKHILLYEHTQSLPHLPPWKWLLGDKSHSRLCIHNILLSFYIVRVVLSLILLLAIKHKE